MTSKLVKTKDAAFALGVTPTTIRTWADKGKIDFIRTAGGQRRYDLSSYDTTAAPANLVANFGNSRPTKKEPTGGGAIYARVSSRKQVDDLERQIQALKADHPDYTVYKDVCSGLKYRRPGLKRLLEHVQGGVIKNVVVAHKDRLARFATELIEWIITQAGGTLKFLDQKTRSHEQELTEDLMAIVHVFSCRLNGKRKYQPRKKRAEEGDQGHQEVGTHRRGDEGQTEGSRRRKKSKSSGTTLSLDPSGLDASPTPTTHTMDQGCPEDLQPRPSVRVETRVTAEPSAAVPDVTRGHLRTEG